MALVGHVLRSSPAGSDGQRGISLGPPSHAGRPPPPPPPLSLSTRPMRATPRYVVTMTDAFFFNPPFPTLDLSGGVVVFLS